MGISLQNSLTTHATAQKGSQDEKREKKMSNELLSLFVFNPILHDTNFVQR